MTWTDDRISELVRLWQAGHSASAIGKMLGVSKNSVVGKAHRMDLPARPSPIKRTASARRVAKPSQPAVKPMAPPAAPAAAPARAARAVSGRSCMWPIGDPGDPAFHFCEEPALEGKPYCGAHCAKAYITRSRNEQAA